jgi:hypothetical protein
MGGFKAGGLQSDKALLEKAEKELKTEFIPELYDKAMQKMYGDKYYEMSDEENEDDLDNKR